MLIVTNNDLVLNEYSGKGFEVDYRDLDLIDLFKVVRDIVHKGGVILTHPLSGSIKPNENPYKSIAIELKPDSNLDFESLSIIENSIETVQKFIDMGIRHTGERFKSDYQNIDLTLLDSALCK